MNIENNGVAMSPENQVYAKARLMTDTVMHYCPGCSHGAIHKIIAEVIDELGVEESSIGISPVGCGVFIYNYVDIDWIQASHGRAPSVASAVKRLSPEKLVFTYQGDGDLAAIGTSELIHTCNRGDSVAIIFVNNAIYGMTGGQMSPTTLIGMPTATTPKGRTPDLNGYPFKITDMVTQLDGVCFASRQGVHKPAAVRGAKRAIKKAFENSLAGRGTSIVEIVATCNSGWKMTPTGSNQWMEENIFPEYAIGDLKDNSKTEKQ